MANEGVHALRIMETEKFDVILTDITMPRMGGIEFLGHAKANALNKKAKLFILSGTLDGENLRRVSAIGVASVIIKPFEAHTVVKKVLEKIAAAAPVTPKATVSYDANIIRSVAAAMQEVAQFYLGSDIDVGKPYIKALNVAKGYFSALISLSQGQAMGSVAFSCNANFLKKLAESIFGENGQPLTEELTRDLAGEMCNQIAGKIKINFAKIDYYVNIGLPQVVVGDNHAISHPGKSPVIVIPMKSEDYNFSLEFTMNGSLVKGKPPGAENKEEQPAEDLRSGALFF
ncbi:MAG: response regulator [Chitinophagaceae bacterium]|nr:response regulator [Oligoflexus sp.]